MKEYLVEMVLGATLVVVFFAVSAWQSVGKLSRSEVDRYIRILEEKLPPELADRAEFLSRLRAWGENDDGKPIYMLNVMRFLDRLRRLPGGPTAGTPREANAQYEDAATPMLLRNGGYPIVVGATTRIWGGQRPESNLMVYRSELDSWDRVLLVRYPGRRTFFELVTSPDYLKVMPYKLASLQVLLIPLSGELVIPDLRWVAGGVCLAIFLLVGWIRAAARRGAGRSEPVEQTP